MGGVDNIPNRGVMVKGISKQDIDDIFTIRVAIEGIAVKWAIERMDDSDLEKLRSCSRIQLCNAHSLKLHAFFENY